jgi:SAM-dependent methyltransferase
MGCVPAWWTRAALRALAPFDAAWLELRRRRRSRDPIPVAGAGIQAASPAPCADSDGIAWPAFDPLAHAFWRAQELTLFRRHRGLLTEPLLDLGCGDLAFGCMAQFPQRGVGVDYDLESLKAGAGARSGLVRARGDAGRLPLADGSMGCCVSNSVLEHLPDLDGALAEVRRVLRPGGRFVFTMTLGEFTGQLRTLAGDADAARWVRLFGHHQQASRNDLVARLARQGFVIERSISYQPAAFTARYRGMASPLFQWWERRASPERRAAWRRSLSDAVRQSIDSTAPGQGACLFAVARKE